MKKLITLTSFSLTILLFVLLGSTQVACHKNTDCTCDVKVVDSTGAPVPGATVKLYANINPPGQVQATGSTDGNGEAYFTFKLPAIFDIVATRYSMTGTGLIQLQIGGNVSQTVIIK